MDGVSTLRVFLLLFTAFVAGCSDRTYENIAPSDYSYQKPVQRDDAITVASLSEIGADEEVLTEMIRNRLKMHFGEVDSVLVYKNDRLIIEEYFSGYDIDQTHDLRSATKSITSLLTGIAIDEGILESENLAVFPFFLDDYSQLDNWVDEKNDIQLKHLLNMNTGLECDDDDPLSAGNESRMYRERDWYRFLLEQKLLHSPGDRYGYCTAGVNMLGGIIRKASEETITEFSTRVLFSKLGITNFRWSRMPTESESTGGHLYLRPRDMLKIGIMALNDGQWNDDQVVSQAWITKSQTKVYPDYGYLWWKYAFPAQEENDIPQVEAYYASGNGGQKIFVVPEENLVVAITGSSFNHWQGFWGPIHMMHFYIIPATHAIQ